MPAIPGFAPTLPGVTKTEAPLGGKDLMGDMLSQLAGKPQAPRMSAGDKVAQAVQLLREAAQEDLRIAPLISGALNMLVTGGGPGAGPGQPPPTVTGPASQQAGQAPGSMAALAGLMGGMGGAAPPGA
jgi:hypothetical protein